MERNSAFWKSCASFSSNCLLDDASPNSSTRRPECARATVATAASIGATLSPALAESPRMSKRMSAARPSFERWGAWMLVTAATAPTRACTSADTALRSPAASGPLRVWTRIISPARVSLVGKALSSTFAARPDSPTPVWDLSSVFVVTTALPMTKLTMTNAIQPRIAVQGCVPLQWPIRCARLRLACMSIPLPGCVRCGRAVPGQISLAGEPRGVRCAGVCAGRTSCPALRPGTARRGGRPHPP